MYKKPELTANKTVMLSLTGLKATLVKYCLVLGNILLLIGGDDLAELSEKETFLDSVDRTA